jgi:DNA-binding transcriptional ArsR family regulator
MTVKGPQVRDYTDHDRQLAVIIEASPAYELVLSLFAHQGLEPGEDTGEELSTLVERIESHASPELRRNLDTITGCGEVWLLFLGVVHDLPGSPSIAGFLDAVAGMDPLSLRRLILNDAGIKPSRGFDADLIERAVAGEDGAVAELLADRAHMDGIAAVLDLGAVECRDLLADTLRRFHDEVFSALPDVSAVLERDAAAKRALAGTMTTERLVETATNGITFEMQPQVSGVMLVPSVVIRPWVVIAEHGTLRVFCYSVADEHLEADPDAPPSYLVELYKALGDERRLRILGVLAGDDLSLRDIADRVGLAKSTTHHHLRTLRMAGLVRVIVSEDDKRYSLRRDSIPEAAALLHAYLGTQSTAHG